MVLILAITLPLFLIMKIIIIKVTTMLTTIMMMTILVINLDKKVKITLTSQILNKNQT